MFINLLKRFFYFLYIIIWKGIIKKILFFIHRTHEIERILKSDVLSFSQYLNLSN